MSEKQWCCTPSAVSHEPRWIVYFWLNPTNALNGRMEPARVMVDYGMGTKWCVSMSLPALIITVSVQTVRK